MSKLDSSPAKIVVPIRCSKKMKKRKELDALVEKGKQRKKSGSGSGRELLRNDSESTDTEDFSVSVQDGSLSSKTGLSGNGLLSHGHHHGHQYQQSACSACWPLCVVTVLTASLLTGALLLWMHLALRQEVDVLRQHLGKVEAGSRATPQELHGVHSQLQQLDRNSTRFHEDLQKIGSDLAGLTKQVQSLQQASESLQKSIAAAPQLATLPQDVQSLSKEIASIGSKTTVMETQVKELKAQAMHADEDRTKMAAELKQMRALADQLQNQSKATTVAPSVANYVKEEMAHLDESVEEVNATLMGKVNWIVEDLHHHHELIHGLVNRTSNISNLLDSDQLRNLVNRTVQASLKDLDVNQLQSHVQEIRALREDLDSVEKTVEQLLAKKRETSTTTVSASVRKNAAVRGKKASRDNPFADSTDNPPS